MFFFFKQKTAYEMLRSLVGSEMCIRDRFGLCIVGFGPGGIGPLANAGATSAEALDSLLDAGVCVLEAGEDASEYGKLADYMITANGKAKDFINGFSQRSLEKFGLCSGGGEEHPVMMQIRSLKEYRVLVRRADAKKGATLEQGGEVCRAAARCFQELLEAHPHCRFCTQSTAVQVGLASGYLSLAVVPPVTVKFCSNKTNPAPYPKATPEESVLARRVLLATGGEQNCPDLGEFNDKCMLSDWVQQGPGLEELRARVSQSTNETKVVAIVGGSHSAWSTAILILGQIDDPNLVVEIVHRSPIRVLFANERAADKAGYVHWRQDPDAVDRRGVIYGTAGIRLGAKEFYLKYLNRDPACSRLTCTQVSLLESRQQTGGFKQALERAIVVIPAVGYHTNTVPLRLASAEANDEAPGLMRASSMLMHSYAGELNWYVARDGQLQVDQATLNLHCEHPVLSTLKVLPTIFGVGLGYGINSTSPLISGRCSVARIDGTSYYRLQIGQRLQEQFREPHDPQDAQHAREASCLAEMLIRLKFGARIKRWLFHLRNKRAAEAHMAEEDGGHGVGNHHEHCEFEHLPGMAHSSFAKRQLAQQRRASGTSTTNTPIAAAPAPRLSLIHISEPTRLLSISYAVFCLKKKNIHLHQSTQHRLDLGNHYGVVMYVLLAA
eukprot:TRINITY_DN25324_c0_g1_i2.p1 TRINITY_DN25324_c0_g1~~TRINITY_DN25324_c0_g1_i2.p1  ORF type:complete len:666 (+),score=153.06 TRINITY_DN25324_c0_g1_i2:113-2110(+)